MSRRVEQAARLAWWCAIAIGASVFWWAPYPPMIDLPQHAAQITLLRDLLFGHSPWAGEFQINPLTPYWVGYGSAAPLALWLPVVTVMKLLLTLAYLGFVWGCVALRRRFGADARLDWLAPAGYFGFAYAWGFFTFLIALPIGLGVLLLGERHAARQSLRSGLALCAGGLVLLASHGLVFAYGWLCAGALLLAARPPLRRLPLLALPHAGLAAAAIAYLAFSRKFEAHFAAAQDPRLIWDFGWARLPQLLDHSFGATPRPGMWLLGLALLAMPWLMGARLHRRLDGRWVPFAVALAVLLCVPYFAMKTAYLYQRFTLLLWPTYALLFDAPAAPSGRQPGRWIAHAALCASVLLVLLGNVRQVRQFGQNARDFDTVLAAAEPGQRALAMVFYRSDWQRPDVPVYVHFASWYQAHKQGLVDFNFAWFLPQVVRFRPERMPAVGEGYEWDPGSFDWAAHRGAQYRYFFVRSGTPIDPALFRSAPCAPVTVAHSGTWTLLENCRPPR